MTNDLTAPQILALQAIFTNVAAPNQLPTIEQFAQYNLPNSPKQPSKKQEKKESAEARKLDVAQHHELQRQFIETAKNLQEEINAISQSVNKAHKKDPEKLQKKVAKLVEEAERLDPEGYRLKQETRDAFKEVQLAAKDLVKKVTDKNSALAASNQSSEPDSAGEELQPPAKRQRRDAKASTPEALASALKDEFYEDAAARLQDLKDYIDENPFLTFLSPVKKILTNIATYQTTYNNSFGEFEKTGKLPNQGQLDVMNGAFYNVANSLLSLSGVLDGVDILPYAVDNDGLVKSYNNYKLGTTEQQTLYEDFEKSAANFNQDFNSLERLIDFLQKYFAMKPLDPINQELLLRNIATTTKASTTSTSQQQSSATNPVKTSTSQLETTTTASATEISSSSTNAAFKTTSQDRSTTQAESDSTTTTNLPDSTTSSASPAHNSSADGGLSSEKKAGIGVGVTAAIFALLVAALRKLRANERVAPDLEAGGEVTINRAYEVTPVTNMNEGAPQYPQDPPPSYEAAAGAQDNEQVLAAAPADEVRPSPAAAARFDKNKNENYSATKLMPNGTPTNEIDL